MTNTDTKFLGWTNQETWNVVSDISNNAKLLDIARKSDGYSDFLYKTFRIREYRTTNGTLWQGVNVDFLQLSEYIRKLRE